MSSFVVITGMSGAGRSQVANNLEDLGWFVMDNLPPALIPKVVELADSTGSSIDRLALVVGAGPYQEEMLDTISNLREGIPTLKLLFLDATTGTLVRRYESTRRRHPFWEASTLADAIASERAALKPLRAEADLVVDTTELHVHQLRERIVELFQTDDDRAMRVTVMSFGYTYGIPLDADIVIDCRFLPNPHWVPELRPQSGLDAAVSNYVMTQPMTGEFLERLQALLELLFPCFVAEGKSYLTVAFGCTGGRHRSVAVTEHFAGVTRSLGHAPAVMHRDVNK